jgi:hypothetical protein
VQVVGAFIFANRLLLTGESNMIGRRSVLMSVLAVALLSASATACGINESPGTGEKVGQVVKLSKVGIICKTWEGQLIRGGMTDGSGTIGTQPFNFTIETDELAQKVTNFMRTQQEVRVTYSQEGVYALCRTESGGAFLRSIEPLRPSNAPLSTTWLNTDHYPAYAARLDHRLRGLHLTNLLDSYLLSTSGDHNSGNLAHGFHLRV